MNKKQLNGTTVRALSYNAALSSIILGGAILLTACGGGGSSPETATATATATATPTPVKPEVPAKTIYYRPKAPQSGDQYLMAIVGTTSLSTSSSVGFNAIQKVGQTLPDGSFLTTSYYSFPSYPVTALNDAAFATLQLQDCSFAPARNSLPLPWYVGQVATQTSVMNCPLVAGQDRGATSVSSAKVLSYEPITVTAGTFNTLRVQEDRTITFKNGRLPTIIHETCWVDVDSGYDVQCKGGESVDATELALELSLPTSSYVVGGTSGQFSYTQTLQSVTHADPNTLALTALINNVPLGALYLMSTDTDVSTVYLTPGESFQVQSSQASTWTTTDIVYATAAAPLALRTAQAAPLPTPTANYRTQSVPTVTTDAITHADGMTVTIPPPVVPLNPLPLIVVSADKRTATYAPLSPALGTTYPSDFTLTATSVSDPKQIIKIKISVIISPNTLGATCTSAYRFC